MNSCTKNTSHVPFSITVVALLIFGVLPFIWFIYVVTPELWPEYRAAQSLIKKIEDFKECHSRLPSDIGEVAPEYEWDEGPLYYDRRGENTYIVSFGLTVGESYSYDSSTRKWY